MVASYGLTYSATYIKIMYKASNFVGFEDTTIYIHSGKLY